MPSRDRTGPWGHGPKTGRVMGPCVRGAGPMMGMHRKFTGYTPTKEQEMADLRAEKEMIENDLKEIEARLKELEKK